MSFGSGKSASAVQGAVQTALGRRWGDACQREGCGHSKAWHGPCGMAEVGAAQPPSCEHPLNRNATGCACLGFVAPSPSFGETLSHLGAG